MINYIIITNSLSEMKLKSTIPCSTPSVFQNKDNWSLLTIVYSVHMWRELLLQFKRGPPPAWTGAGLPLSLSHHYHGPFFSMSHLSAVLTCNVDTKTHALTTYRSGNEITKLIAMHASDASCLFALVSPLLCPSFWFVLTWRRTRSLWRDWGEAEGCLSQGQDES